MKSYNGFSPAQRVAGDKAVKQAILEGRYTLVKRCQMCSSTKGHIWVHLEDYSRPIEDARPLCVECHMQLHKRYSFPNTWRRYCLALRKGFQPKPWSSYSAYITNNPFNAKLDGPPVDFTPDPAKWWENLSMDREAWAHGRG